MSLHTIHLIEISSFYKFSYSLWHSSNNKILSEIVHCHAMHHLSHLMLFLKVHSYKRHQGFIVQCPQELLEIHRIHQYFFLLRRNHDILNVLFDRNKRTSLDIIVASIFNQILDSSTSPRIQLHFIKDNNRFSWI